MFRGAAIALCLVAAGCVGEVTGELSRSDRDGQIVVLEGEQLAAELRGSPVREAHEPFVRVGAMWEGDRPESFEIAVSADGAAWSPWRPLVVEHIELEATGAFVGQLELGEPAIYYRLRAADGTADFLRLELLTTTLGESVEDGDEQAGATARTLGGVEINDRASWGARAHRCSSSLGSVYRVAIHHTETPTVDTLSPQARLRAIQSYHMNTRGWCDIGYHYLMSRDGRLWEGRPAALLGAHAGGANTGNVGISVMGSHGATPITDDQMASLAGLVRALADQHGVALTRAAIKGHRQYTATSCPGDRLYAQLDDVVARAAAGEGEDPGSEPGECDSGPQATDGAWSCGGFTGTTTNATDVYYTTSFGCWVDELGTPHGDAGDNCIPACSLASIGCDGLSGPACERAINWYAADSDRFGCGTKLHVSNPDTGAAAVLMVIDRGPSCSIERLVDHWVLDMSYRASYYLFGEPTAATERADVVVAIAPPDAPLGPVTGAVCEGDGDADPATVTVMGVLYTGSDTSTRIAGATVMLGSRTTTTDASGLWQFEGVAAGEFTVTASAPGYQARSVTATTYADETWASFGLSPAGASSGEAVLQGVVYYSSDSGNRIPGATVELSTGHTATADANGFYKLTSLPAGPVTITATAPGYTTSSVTRTLTDGETTWGSVSLSAL